MNERHISVCQQTQALLHTNFLKKWRMKRESILEWLISLLLLLYLFLFSKYNQVNHFSELSPMPLGRVDKFNDSDLVVAYTPISNTTQKIMDKMATAPFMKGRKIIPMPNQEAMDAIIPKNYSEMVGIIFMNNFSYELKFNWGYRTPIMKEHLDHSAHCFEMFGEITCSLTSYWERGFVAFQAAINAAIIEIATNHSVMDMLMAVSGINMKTLPFIAQGGFLNEIFIFFCIISFSPLIYFASLNITRDRKNIKEWMTMMGLQSSAFWLSWGLLYAGYIFIMATFLALVTSTHLVVMTGYFVLFILFLLYGLSVVALAFLLCVLIKKPLLTGLIAFLLTVFWGCLAFATLYKQLPASLEWILCLLSPFAFSAGMVRIILLDYDLRGVTFPDPSGDSYLILATFSILFFDVLFYLALTLYFDKILPNEYGRQQSPLFFLKSSFWFQKQKTVHEILENEINTEHYSDCFEPISPEFHGKEAIRIRNIQKEYKGKPEKVEALKGLLLDIYEGQITALLGHSGAGKSTLLNILSGLSVPTEGSATIYNNKLSEMTDLEKIRKIIGVCPQCNIQLDFLTARENLRLFAKIKGIHPQKVEQEVQQILTQLEMKNIQDTLAINLSGGQKRKLSFGIAILGDPKILLLDEPTAGLDPFSRHQVWNLLKERKSDHVILFSTQFMDEADLLADRKVFISSGRLKCAGSSLFLKRKWGIGYHLSLHRNEICDPERITSLVKHHIPDAKLAAESDEKLVYTLPLERTNKFPDLYTDLDNCSDQGIVNYGVSVTTLNEVFLQLEGKTTDESDFGIWGQEKIEMTRDARCFVELEQALSSVSSMITGMALWRKQVCAIARIRLLKLKHEKKAFLCLLLVFGIGYFPFIMENILYRVFRQTNSWGLSPNMYFLSPGQQPHTPLTSLLVVNNTGSNLEDFVHSLKHQNIVLEVVNFRNKNGIEDPSYNGAIIISGKRKHYRFSVACNTKRLNCFPVLMGVISNGLLGIFNPSEHIQTKRSTFFHDDVSIGVGFMEASFFCMFIATSISPYIAMGSISDYKIKAQSQLWISGLYPSAYWCGQSLVDIPLYCMILFLMYVINYLMNNTDEGWPTSIILFAQILCTIGYAASVVVFTYVISFIFRKRRKNSGLWFFCFFIISMFLFGILFLNNFELLIMLPCMILVPLYTLVGCLMLFYGLSYNYSKNPDHHEDEIDGISQSSLLVVLIPYLHIIILLFVLRFLEMKYGKKSMRKDPVFRISPRSSEVFPNQEEPEGEDEDVQAERARTTSALAALNLDEKPVIIASCLRKEYEVKKKICFSKSKKKLATRNVSFCVKKGEVLGLLGHNGAGKSTSIRMITGEIRPTAGEVVLKGNRSSLSQQGADTIKFLGYCPQENSLWRNLTVRDHLEVFAAVKGMKKEDATIMISRLANVLKLQEHMNISVKELSAGITRKLCFALSILGNPAVVLLDEPSTGMDPEGQQQMWKVIRATFKNKESGAILTTHYMAEAEAVCDRVAIMVSGQLKCIGSIQHLKSKFGKDYLLEIKVKEPEQVEPLHAEILKLFPQAARQERYSSLMVYKLPVEVVYPLSQAFSKLEAAKSTFNLEEYSLSQSTLEQVFLELSKEQELGDLDVELDTTVKWKLLPQEEP
ncbi:ATP-binding cassette sub-family A member 10-like [Antechinus flavipes]|uniref:ATP-binding cassette sub-family A member 10-like n=1 Tax=Antechinus flavipes TaxID=38775 RepID=UPI00223660D5|nr:ATP-binding cassette sub-family A member 10-like [Antechinus flavipes]